VLAVLVLAAVVAMAPTAAAETPTITREIRHPFSTVQQFDPIPVAGFSVVGAGQALARHVGCGDTITTDTTLDSDLVNCPNNGIVIGADNITLDLNGHTIAGDGMRVDSCPEGEDCDVGVLNGAGYDGMTIVGGTIRQFGVGILVHGGVAHPRLQQLAASNNLDLGIIVVESTDSVIEKTSMSDNGISGLIVADSQRALVARNTVTGSHGFAMNFFAVDASRIQHNTLDGNDHGMQVVAGSSDNTIRSNAVSHSGGSAIEVGDERNRVERNRLRDNGDGILVGASDTLISGNIVTGTGVFGFPDTGGFGIGIGGAVGTTVDRNIVTGGRGPAISLLALETPPSRDVVISRNHVSSKLSDGIQIDGATGTLLVRNIAIGNGDDGIDVEDAATTLTRNLANHNRDLGIEAVPGVIDGGGNHAVGNGNPAQCSNVAC
jgi:parallel beta-helix repeat protein